MKCGEIVIDIEDATESDAAAILEIQKLAFHGQGVLYDDFMLPPLVQTLDGLYQDFQRHVFLKVISDGKIVGAVRGRAEGDTCFISRLIVLPEYQNKGIGRRLMAAIEERFDGVRRFELFTGHKSEKNLAFYARLGYREFRRKPQNANVTLVCMEKKKEQ